MNARKVASAIRKAAREYYGQRVRVEIGIRPSIATSSKLRAPLVANQVLFAKGADLWSTVPIEEALGIPKDPHEGMLFVMDGYVYSPGIDGELITNCDIWLVDGEFVGLLDSVGNSGYVKQLAAILHSTTEHAEEAYEIVEDWKR
jgi:hypothetical protein